MTEHEDARRIFWEQAFHRAFELEAADAVIAGIIADQALREWDKRWPKEEAEP